MFDENAAGLLVTEIHHRVMNSYQVIFSLAERCTRVRDMAELQPIVDDLAERLSAFAALHRQLAIPPSGSFAEYCSNLGNNLVAAFGRTDVVRVRMDAVNLPARWLSRIALIIAELLTNCLKHSLTSTAPGSIYLDLRVSFDRLIIEAQDSAAPPVSHGLPDPSRVISALTASLGGDACVIDRGGYCAQVSLPLHTLDKRISAPAREPDAIRSLAPMQQTRLARAASLSREPLSLRVPS